MGIPLIGELVKGAGKILDDLHTSGEEKLAAHNKLVELQLAANETFFEYEKARINESAETIRAEAASEHWLAANWRPLMMINFGALITAHWLGYTATNLRPEEVLSLLEIVKVALGGYVLARTAEKVAPHIPGSGRNKGEKNKR